jgi:GTP-binding protein SAR1
MFDWLWRWLGYLGLYQKRGKILLLGLDNAGKTTLLHMIRDDRVVTHAPTQRATKEELTLGGVLLECYDLGGHEEAREIWKDYFVDANAIVFMVDAAEPARFAESKRELDSLLTSEALRRVPVLVLGNKVDLPNAVPEAALRQALGLQHTTGKNVRMSEVSTVIRPIELFMCSVVNRFGFADGFKWVAEYL